jgi:ABC-type Mn2+/Zn2+ transport system permease subunit
VPSPVEALELPFIRTALVEVALVAVAGGVLGTWIVLRRLAFFTHGVGAAAFPALVVAGPVGISPQLAALAAGLGYASGVRGVARSGRDLSAATALLLVASLATGAVLASDVVEPSAGVDQLLFGTLLGLDDSDLALSAAAAALALFATLALGRAWLASGFDPDGARALPLPLPLLDALLLTLIAAAAVAAVPAVGALLVTSLFIVPAATARLIASTVRGLVVGAVALAGLQGIAGLYLAYALDISPGPAIAALGGALYGCVAAGEATLRRRKRQRRSTPSRALPASLAAVVRRRRAR